MYQEGNYLCRITGQAITTTKTGSFQLEMEILPFKAEDEVIEGQKFKRRIFLPLTQTTLGTPESPGWVAETLEQLGFIGRDYDQLDLEQPGFQTFLGKEIACYCKHEEWNDQPREKWAISKARQAKAKPPKGALAALGGVSTAGPAPADPAVPF